MCGIAGLWDTAAATAADELRRLTLAMSDSLVHRGPDDGGLWVDEAAGIGLGQRRLSIVDLSPAGHQPMVSACGRYVIVYNGEVYSHEEIRPELTARGIRFRGHSDTEVILEAMAVWGVEATVARLIGMFAIALWDRQKRTLTLVRDRLGIKPVYWRFEGGRLLFGSELKALRANPGWIPEVDQQAVSSFLRLNYVPAPRTIYKGVRKLEPGCILSFRVGAEPVESRYWDARTVARTGIAAPFTCSDQDLIDRLDILLKDAVGRRMIADVPLGAFLSGGIDSSLVVALMQAQSTGRVRSFSIGFEEAGYDEAPHAKAVAAHLGTEHTELYVSSAHALETIPRLADWYDEPFADSSQIPTFLVSEMTRRHVTVALSGDGGDELFAGYNRYFLGAALWRKLGWLPASVRRSVAGAIRAVPVSGWDRVAACLPKRFAPPQAGDKAGKFADILGLADAGAVYRRLVSSWEEPEALLPGVSESHGVLWDEDIAREFPDLVTRMQFMDLVTYLPDDILTKVDRASMAVALEARVPILDHRVVEFSARVPFSARIRDGQGKWLLRRVLDRYVPRALIERPKMGFGIPIDSWLRGPLREWSESLLEPSSLAEAGLEPTPIRRVWQEHLGGGRNWQYRIWTILMLQAWRRRWLFSSAHGVA
ncbi:MAG: asparagine synthase (glutamine-hydrolyzing) [Rhodospirillaceae bacterium]